MIATDLTYTEKWRDVLKDDSQVIFLEGPSQTSKTTLSGVKLLKALLDSPEGQTIFYLCGESTPTLYRNFVEPETSITKLFPYVANYVGGQRGGERIEVVVPYDNRRETKKIFFIGFNNKSAGNKILGGKPYLIFIDEINKAHDQFLKETFTRIQAVGARLIATTNGDSPDKLCYEYLNACRPLEKYENDVPQSTMNELLDTPAKEGWTYYFFGLDDRPNATKKWIEGMYTMHPEGSFEYNSKVLGIRSVVDGILYGHILNKLNDVQFDKLNLLAIKTLTIGIDVGSGAEEKAGTKRAKSIVVLSGYSRLFQRMVVIDGYASHEIGHIEMTNELNQFLDEYIKVFAHKIKGVYIDNAEPALISTCKSNIKYGVRVQGSIKKTAIVNSKSRVTVKEQMIFKRRMLFVKGHNDRPKQQRGAQFIKQQLAKVKGLNGVTIDEEMLHNDVNDAVDYSMTPHYEKLQKYKMR